MEKSINSTDYDGYFLSLALRINEQRSTLCGKKEALSEHANQLKLYRDFYRSISLTALKILKVPGKKGQSIRFRSGLTVSWFTFNKSKGQCVYRGYQ